MQRVPLCENKTAAVPVLYGNYVPALQRFNGIKMKKWLHESFSSGAD